jgi:hypothetical protein
VFLPAVPRPPLPALGRMSILSLGSSRRGVRRLAALAASGTGLVAALVASPAAVRAQASQLRFDGVNGTHAFGYYVGPFSGTLLRPGTATALTLFCVDFLNHVGIGETQSVSITSLAGTDLDQTRHPDKLLAYRKAAWLTTKFDPAQTGQWGGIQAAIWELISPGNPNGGTDGASNTTEAYWLQQANLFVASAGYSTYDWSRFYVLTDVRAAGVPSGVGMQEFITGSPNIVPEPETVMLLAGGLAGIALFAWHRRRTA